MLKIIPLGGIGEIGMNMTLIESEGTSVLVDSGMLFSSTPYYGIEAVVADYRAFSERFDNVKALFITHGHEDHIGGIPYLLEQYKLKIYAYPFAAALIRKKCGNYSKRLKPDIEIIGDNDVVELGNLSVSFIPTSHSIPDACALFIQSKEAKLLYATDFRIDSDKGTAFLNRVREIKESHGKIDILLSDSTNVTDEEESLCEDDVFKGLEGYFQKAKKKIIVTMFSSNIGRINQIIELAKKYNRRLFISGHNIKSNMSIARDLGYLVNDEGCIRPESEFKRTDDEEIVLICTGSQAEKRSSIVKLSNGYHPFAYVDEGDYVIFSSSQIPGNEKAIIETVNRLVELGAEVVYSESDRVHCSGHPGVDELNELFKAVMPDIFIPLHGEFIHLKEHVALAIENGVGAGNAVILKCGNEFVYDGKDFVISEIKTLERKYVDSCTRDLIDIDIIRDRARIAENGLIVVSLIINNKGRVTMYPGIDLIGVSRSKKVAKLIDSLKGKISDFCMSKKFPAGEEKNIQDLKGMIKREFRRRYDNKPEVLISIIR